MKDLALGAEVFDVGHDALDQFARGAEVAAAYHLGLKQPDKRRAGRVLEQSRFDLLRVGYRESCSRPTSAQETYSDLSQWCCSLAAGGLGAEP